VWLLVRPDPNHTIAIAIAPLLPIPQVSWITAVAVLATFGLLFPPAAAVIAVSVWLETSISQLLLRRCVFVCWCVVFVSLFESVQ
jgi:hypothetical protein